MLICLAIAMAACDPYFVSTLANSLWQVLIDYLVHLAHPYSVISLGRAELKAASVAPLRYRDSISSATNGDAVLRESLSPGTPHRPRCGQLPIAKSETALRRPGMGINANSW